jgi:hypothetical protein
VQSQLLQQSAGAVGASLGQNVVEGIHPLSGFQYF